MLILVLVAGDWSLVTGYLSTGALLSIGALELHLSNAPMPQCSNSPITNHQVTNHQFNIFVRSKDFCTPDFIMSSYSEY